MTPDFRPYPKMGNSDVPWLGEVPAHWEVMPARALFVEVKDQNHPDEPLLSVTISKGVIRQSDLLADSSKKDSSNQDKAKYKLVQPGDIAYNKMRAWQGAVGCSSYRGIVSPAYIVQRPRVGVSARFMHYLLRTPNFAKEAERWSYGITSDQWSLRPEHFKMIYCCLPPPSEQTALVRFLDHATRRIGKAIRAKQKLIKLMEEERQAIIRRTVTRGLDPSVRLKPSGVEWLGEIPAHWATRQVRRVVSLVTSGSRGWAEYYSDEGDIFIQSGNLGRTMSLSFSYTQHVRPPSGAEGIRTSVQFDDVLICITGALTGNVAIVDVALPGRAFVNQHVALLRPKPRVVLPRYLAYVLSSEVGKSQFKTSEYGGTKQGLGLDDVKSAVITLPPISEQGAICKYLEASLANIAEAALATNRGIDLLREYRTRLIADVVTGKLDVREAAARLPEDLSEVEAADGLEDWADGESVESDDADEVTAEEAEA